MQVHLNQMLARSAVNRYRKHVNTHATKLSLQVIDRCNTSTHGAICELYDTRRLQKLRPTSKTWVGRSANRLSCEFLMHTLNSAAVRREYYRRHKRALLSAKDLEALNHELYIVGSATAKHFTDQRMVLRNHELFIDPTWRELFIDPRGDGFTEYDKLLFDKCPPILVLQEQELERFVDRLDKANRKTFGTSGNHDSLQWYSKLGRRGYCTQRIVLGKKHDQDEDEQDLITGLVMFLLVVIGYELRQEELNQQYLRDMKK